MNSCGVMIAGWEGQHSLSDAGMKIERWFLHTSAQSVADENEVLNLVSMSTLIFVCKREVCTDAFRFDSLRISNP